MVETKTYCFFFFFLIFLNNNNNNNLLVKRVDPWVRQVNPLMTCLLNGSTLL